MKTVWFWHSIGDVDQESNLSSATESVLCFWAFCSFRLILLLSKESWMILFSAEANLASSTSKFGIEIPRVDGENFKSSTESTNSTSLIQSIASVRNCEQVHTSVLKCIFKQASVAGVVNLSKRLSEICSCCWSATKFIEESPSLGMTGFLADGPNWHLSSWTGVWFSVFSAVDEWIGSDIPELHVFNSCG